MAEVFKNAKAVLTASSEYDEIYVCPAGTKALILLAQVANVDDAEQTVDIGWTDSSDSDTLTHLIKDAPIPVGGALNVLGGKLTLEAGDALVAMAEEGSVLEVTLSILEIS